MGNCCYVAVCRRGGRLGGAKCYGAHMGRRGARRGGAILLHCALAAAQFIVISPVCGWLNVCVCVCGCLWVDGCDLHAPLSLATYLRQSITSACLLTYIYVPCSAR